MKTIVNYLGIVLMLLIIINQTFAREYPPGSGGQGTWMVFRYTVDVKDPNNNPVSNVAVRLTVFYTLYLGGGNIESRVEIVNGQTDSNGHVFLEAWADVTCCWPEGYNFNYMYVSITDPNYTVLSSTNTTSNFPTASGNFTVVYDRDGDEIDDNLEQQLAYKFSPVLHKHSWEKQYGLSNVDWILSNGISNLKVYNNLGQTVYSTSMYYPAQIHVSLGTGDRDSFGVGEMWAYWKLDINNSYRYQAAPVGQRPLYYHVYKEGNYYYVQYWFFFGMNDLINQTTNHTWHEGDFEHVSIKVNLSLDPVAVNFYRHEGGRTVSPANCWWSSSNTKTYSQIQQGYSSTRTHLHVWIAANSHASYNRYDPIYHITAEGLVDPCPNLSNDNYYDNADYEPSGYDLYFEYDFLENLGEFEQSPLQQASNGGYYPYAHGYFWFEHNVPKKFSKSWLTFIGRFGEFWLESCGGFFNWLGRAGTNSPLSPIYGDANHEWKSFTENYNPWGFGNYSSDNSFFGIVFTYITITWDPDLLYGD